MLCVSVLCRCCGHSLRFRRVGPATLPVDVMDCTTHCFLPTDVDGIVQSNFIAAPPRHPFLRDCLAAFTHHAPHEPHVLLSTGPWMITTLHTLTDPHDVTLLPPQRFYPHHWRPGATTFPEDDCYGVHTWDTSWTGGSGYGGYGYTLDGGVESAQLSASTVKLGVRPRMTRRP